MSNGRLEIKVFGAGELVPGFEAFDAVSEGNIEMSSSTAYYWLGKMPASVFFTGVPFGMNTAQISSWILAGDGMNLWRELYAKFNVLPFAGGNTGMQPAGWFRKEINSIEDFKGLKMRISGLGAKTLEKCGTACVLLPGGEIYTSLERGVIDAAEWVGPYHDYKMGFHKIAKYYYPFGWHEPTGQLEYLVNKSAYDKLPTDLQQILEAAIMYSQAMMKPMFDVKNGEYILKIKEDKNIKMKTFSQDIINRLNQYAAESFSELISKDKDCKRIYSNFVAHKKKVSAWMNLTEKEYFNKI